MKSENYCKLLQNSLSTIIDFQPLTFQYSVPLPPKVFRLAPLQIKPLRYLRGFFIFQ